MNYDGVCQCVLLPRPRWHYFLDAYDIEYIASRRESAENEQRGRVDCHLSRLP